MKTAKIVIVTIVIMIALGVVGLFMIMQDDDRHTIAATYLGEWVAPSFLPESVPTNVVLREDGTFTVSQPGRYTDAGRWIGLVDTRFEELLPGFSEREILSSSRTMTDYLVVTHGTFQVERGSIVFTISDGSTVTYSFTVMGDIETTFNLRRGGVITTRVPAENLSINRTLFNRV